MIAQISDSEMEIMQIIWSSNGVIMFAQLMEELEVKGSKWKPNTVLTFLVRLEEKGVISSVKNGRTKEYTPILSENEYLETQAKTFLQKVYGGNVKGLVSALLKQESMTKQDFDELSEFWRKGGGASE